MYSKVNEVDTGLWENGKLFWRESDKTNSSIATMYHAGRRDMCPGSLIVCMSSHQQKRRSILGEA